MTTNRFRRIVVVGGGTAGWLAACYLQRVMGADPATAPAIELVESAELGVIGVGEATVPTLRNTLALLGIPEADLFEKVDASLKNGIRFVGWRHGGSTAQDFYDHPFDTLTPFEGYSTGLHWLNLMQRGATTAAMAQVSVVQTALFDDNLSPKMMHSPEYQAPVPYGYHVDAVKLGQVLKATAMARGVQHTTGTITDVRTDEHGIQSLRLADGRDIAGDFFIDCSGFASLLLGKALGVPWRGFDDTLLCDRAVACPVAHADAASPLRSYTVSTAKAAGWTWDIDLQSRRGTGYVYSSRHCSDDEAVQTLLAHHGSAQRLAEPRLLRMRVGHYARPWEKNCLALGLAGGFIEPLESTAIYLIEYALQAFIDHLPATRGGDHSRNRFNALMQDLYEEIRDFVLAHYALSQRQDSEFWRSLTQPANWPQSLKDMLDLWSEKLPTPTDMQRRLSLFGAHNWFFILAGLHYLPAHGSGQARFVSAESSIRALEYVRGIREAARKQSPSMRDYAHKMRAATQNRPLPQQPASR